MDGCDGTNRIPRMGRRHNTWTHWKWQLQLVCCVIRHIHHSDDCVTGNDVLHYHEWDYRDHIACVHVGHYRGCVLVVPEYLWKRYFNHSDKRNGKIQRDIELGPDSNDD